jgi:hypothetical protein
VACSLSGGGGLVEQPRGQADAPPGPWGGWLSLVCARAETREAPSRPVARPRRRTCGGGGAQQRRAAEQQGRDQALRAGHAPARAPRPRPRHLCCRRAGGQARKKIEWVLFGWWCRPSSGLARALARRRSWTVAVGGEVKESELTQVVQVLWSKNGLLRGGAGAARGSAPGWETARRRRRPPPPLSPPQVSSPSRPRPCLFLFSADGARRSTSPTMPKIGFYRNCE